MAGFQEGYARESPALPYITLSLKQHRMNWVRVQGLTWKWLKGQRY